MFVKRWSRLLNIWSHVGSISSRIDKLTPKLGIELGTGHIHGEIGTTPLKSAGLMLLQFFFRQESFVSKESNPGRAVFLKECSEPIYFLLDKTLIKDLDTKVLITRLFLNSFGYGNADILILVQFNVIRWRPQVILLIKLTR